MKGTSQMSSAKVFVFIIIVQFVMSANNRIRFVLKIVFVCLYITPSDIHHCANLSAVINLMKCLPDIFCRVCEQDKTYSLWSIIQYVGLCVFSFPISLWWLREYIYFVLWLSSNRKYELLPIYPFYPWTFTHLGLGHETMVWAVCLFVFLFFLIKIIRLKITVKT